MIKHHQVSEKCDLMFKKKKIKKVFWNTFFLRLIHTNDEMKQCQVHYQMYDLLQVKDMFWGKMIYVTKTYHKKLIVQCENGPFALRSHFIKVQQSTVNDMYMTRGSLNNLLYYQIEILCNSSLRNSMLVLNDELLNCCGCWKWKI